MRAFDPHAAAAAAVEEDPQRRIEKQDQAERQRAKHAANKVSFKGGHCAPALPLQLTWKLTPLPPCPSTHFNHAITAQASKSGAPKPPQQQALVDEDGTDLSEFLVQNDGYVGGKRGGGASSSSSGSGSDAEPDDGKGGRRGPFSSAPLPPARKPQVIFCSRTHSQLSQFVGELHRTRFADTLTLVPVASRRALCVNEQVTKLADLTAINERCMELQQTKRSKSRRTGAAAAPAPAGQAVGLAALARSAKRETKGGCPFLQRGGSSNGSSRAPGGRLEPLEEFKELVLAAPADVEDLARMGRGKGVCAYYGSRLAVPEADIILAPYRCVRLGFCLGCWALVLIWPKNSPICSINETNNATHGLTPPPPNSALLSADARSALGLDPEGSVLVFDEAHNLLDAINGAHGCGVTGAQLASVQRQAAAYHERFKGVLSPPTARQVQLLLKVVGALLGWLAGRGGGGGGGGGEKRERQGSPPAGGGGGEGGGAMRVNQLLFDSGLDNINLFELLRWMKETKFVFKVRFFTCSRLWVQQPLLI
jgi:chromosome transmission fidelity protein 1